MTNTWECNLCYRDGFSDLPSVNDHFSPQSNLRDCPGIPLGARVRLEGGLIGFLPIKNISDSFTEKYRDPKKILKVNVKIHM
jgi:hypothetical protein